MRLSRKEERMLKGEMGEAVKQALQLQLEVGAFFGARELVLVSNVHMNGDME